MMPSQCDKNEGAPFFSPYKSKYSAAQDLDTGDIERSLKRLLETHYAGSVRFEGEGSGERISLFDKYELARMIKSVIKELTLSRTCKIRFVTEDGSFIIIFEAHKDTPISDASAKHLVSEGEHLGLYLASDEACIKIYVPTKSVPMRIYNYTTYFFYDTLISVFSE